MERVFNVPLQSHFSYVEFLSPEKSTFCFQTKDESMVSQLRWGAHHVWLPCVPFLEEQNRGCWNIQCQPYSKAA